MAGLAGTLIYLARDGAETPSPHSPVGWMAVSGAVVAFGSYGLLYKLPAVAATAGSL